MTPDRKARLTINDNLDLETTRATISETLRTIVSSAPAPAQGEAASAVRLASPATSTHTVSFRIWATRAGDVSSTLDETALELVVWPKPGSFPPLTRARRWTPNSLSDARRAEPRRRDVMMRGRNEDGRTSRMRLLSEGQFLISK